jgi:general secretion pathway protein J
MNRTLGKSTRPGGFTLVELLLAITLMSMLLALAYGGLRASTRATDRGQVVLEESSRMRMAHQFIHKQLNQILPLAYEIDEEQKERKFFEGSRQRIRFVGPMPGYLSFGGPQVQELSIEPGEHGQALLLSHALLQGYEESRLYERAPILLMDHIEDAWFSFLQFDEYGNVAGWTSDWPDPDVMPKAISLEIEFEDDVVLRWPMLTASVRIDASALQDLAGGQSLRGTTVQDLIKQRRNQD